SETALGWLLQEVEAQPYISTKFRIDTTDLFDISGQIERSLHESLERLQKDKVTLLQLHNPIGAQTTDRMIGLSDVLKPHGVLDALENLRHQGLFDHFGITALGDTPSIIKVLKSNRIASAQVYFNMLNPSAGMVLPPSWPVYNFTGIIDTCIEHGVAPMNIRVFSAGVIATQARHGRERPLTPGDTVDSETAKATAIFDVIADRFGSRAQTAIRFALAQPRLACIVFGLAELEHLTEALAAEDMGPLSSDDLALIADVYTQFKGWQKR
ncbi:MAG: aldo/keto reductase, partial [Pseudomonadales bacterium]